tara:strand:+ start:577 stop:1479 length:903 start_codon:yes stop_codon:yes gene_type:complete
MNTDKITKIVELVIADDSEELAIDAISLVTTPAIEQDFVFFGKEKNNLTFAKVDEEKRMLISPALIPNKQIFRYDPNTDSEYYVYFSPETVRKASELYLKHNNHHKATYQHQDRVSGVLTVESWIKEGDQDKSKMYGYDLPNGTWFVKMKINNDDLWQEIKSGNLRGLSIEGYFTNKFEQMNSKKPTDQQILTALNEIIKESQKVKKVELGLADDIEKEYDKAAGLEKNVSKAAAKLRSEVLKAADAWDKVEVLSMKGLKAAKELGVKEAEKLFSSRGSDAQVNNKEMKAILGKIDSFQI